MTVTPAMNLRRNYISAIPPELLASVFQLAQQPAEPQDDYDEPPQLLPIELIVSHVCIYWRRLALNTALLWRYITIDQTGSTEKLRAYLARSGPQTPLHFQLDLTHAPRAAAMAEKLDLVFDHLERWQRLTIHADIERSEMPIMARMHDVQAPALERLVLCIDDVDRETLNTVRTRTALDEQILTQGCPRLKVLRLRGLPMHFFRPPLKNITTLYLEQTRGLFFGFEGFKHLLSSAPALAHLSIHDTILDDNEETWPWHHISCIPVPHLTSLRLATPCTLQPLESGVLIALAAPRLTALVLKDPGTVALDPFARLPGAAHKFPALRALTFCDFDFNSAELLCPLARAIPGVEEFTRIHSTLCTPAVLLVMAGRWTDTDAAPRQDDAAGAQAREHELWPRLHTLNTTLDVSDLPLVRAAVERRQRLGFPLRVLRISESVFDEAEEDDELETLDWLRANLAVLEPFVAVERWPPGGEYDPDDTMFA